MSEIIKRLRCSRVGFYPRFGWDWGTRIQYWRRWWIGPFFLLLAYPPSYWAKRDDELADETSHD